MAHTIVSDRNNEEMIELLERAGFDVEDSTWGNDEVPSCTLWIDDDLYQVFAPDEEEFDTYQVMDQWQIMAEFDDPRDVVDFLNKL